MKLTELFLAELDREALRTRRALEQVPLGRDDWKPHPKSFPLGHLTQLVATMPGWITNVATQTKLDLSQAPGYGFSANSLRGWWRNAPTVERR